MWFVYVLRCANGHLNTGCTENLDDRISRHATGYVTATKMRRPVVLATYISFTNKYKAPDFERHLKTGSLEPSSTNDLYNNHASHRSRH